MDAAGVPYAFGADGVWGEHRNQSLQAHPNTQRSDWRTRWLLGVADSGWSWHQQTGLLLSAAHDVLSLIWISLISQFLFGIDMEI